ncbi:hypothetical protein J4N45_04895 [Vibrio sp. SCSIO 43140]|jgi:hypothetical protein|uniref:hypothetical protein n=1 Tax=Vibrio sp. SCSIO 43140 TaxID=2819100 RepID=UPI0020760685|nr:hypothetical protein [Vibrio sp. SCSIO 43140]USD61310.1 hypothetical protein J4N45_04895 [Vibrio sp. SCSIO 43140]
MRETKETKWAKKVAAEIHNHLQSISPKYAADVAQKLCYANEVRQYRNDIADCIETKFETDILIYEWIDDATWTPRVVVETKVDSVTTHDAITYSKKAQNHRVVHPFLRYGMFIGGIGNGGVPARLLRHGEAFDFMIAWKDLVSTKEEKQTLLGILADEVETSKRVEKILYNNRSKERQKVTAYHRPLVLFDV